MASYKMLIVSNLGVPFRDAACMVGLHERILTLYRKPQLAEKAMEFFLSQDLEYTKALAEAGAETLYVEEMWASADIISPNLCERFAFPYERLHIES